MARGRPKKNSNTKGMVKKNPGYVPLQPPEGVSRRIRALWAALVNCQSPDFFSESDAPLLLDYCDSLILLHDLRGELAARKEASGSFMYATDTGQVKMLPLVAAVDSAAKTAAALAARCRLSPSSRLPTRSAVTQGTTVPEQWKKLSDGDDADDLFAY